MLWGTGGLTGSLLARHTDLSAPAVATYRLGVGGLLLVLFVAIRRRPWPAGMKAAKRTAILGLLAALFQAGYFAAVAHLSVSLATLITIGASPVLVLLYERRTDPRSLATLALALAGLTLLVGVSGGGNLAGAAFALLAAAGFATLTVVGGRPVEGLDELAATGIGFTIGAAALIPLAQVSGGLGFAPAPASFGLLALLGIGPTAIAYAAYFRGLRTAGAGTAALMSLLEPLVGTALAVLILGDRLGPAAVAGAGLLISALAIEARRGTAGTARRSPPAPGTSPRGARRSPGPRRPPRP